MSYREQAQRWYSSRRWKTRRERQLAAHPLCKFCLNEGAATPAHIADHVQPHRGDYDKFWNGDLQSLCKRHHDSDKKRAESGTSKVKIGLDGWPEEG